MQVIVIDDDPVSRFALVSVIQKIGLHEILEFDDGVPAWDYLRTSPLPVLCCCDVRMPDMSGIELLELVRNDALCQALPFVLITSGHEKGTVKKAVQLGVNGYIVKPFSQNEATSKLKDIFQKELKKVVELSDATCSRLSINRQKLKVYLAGFRQQVDELQKISDYTHDELDIPNFDSQLAAIYKGCQTLGLWHCASQIEILQGRKDRQGSAASYLRLLLSTIDYQIVSADGVVDSG